MTMLRFSTLLMVAHPPMYHGIFSIHSFVLRIHKVEVGKSSYAGSDARMD